MRKALYVMGILDDEDVEWIASRGRNLGVRKDEILIREGEPVEALFILLDGSLNVSSRGAQVATLHSGEIVGEISFVDSLPPSATVTAAQYSHVLAIPRAMLNAKIETDPWFASRFFRALAVFLAYRLRVTTARVAAKSGGRSPGQDEDEIHVDMMDSVSVAAVRFDKMLKRLRGGTVSPHQSA